MFVVGKEKIFADNYLERVINAIASFKNGSGILVLDDESRENEGDLIFPAETLTTQQMAVLIRECSGIVCLCITEEKANLLNLPLMVKQNESKFSTAFTVSIEAKKGVTTGVSAHDRLVTIKTAIDINCNPSDLNRPGHVFPLIAKKGGLFERKGHTEASIEIASLAGFMPAAVISELMNPDGSMARMKEVIEFGYKFGYPVVTIEDLCKFKRIQ